MPQCACWKAASGGESIGMKSTFKTFLERIAAVLLLVAALFALAAIVGFGSLGRQSPWGWAFAVLGIIALVGWFVGRLGSPSTRDKHANQRTMMGVNAVASVLLLLAILVGINYMSARHHRVLDLTKNHINSLSAQTGKVLKEVKEPLQFTYVYAPTESSPQPPTTDQQLLGAYKNASSDIQVKYVNVVNNPLEAQQLQLSNFNGQPLLLIDHAKSKDTSKRQQVTAIDEGNITSALMKVVNPAPKVLYFLGGHGEMSPTESSGKISKAKAALEQQNYTIKSLTLIGKGIKIPEDAAAVVVVAPEQDLSSQEAQLLKKYIDGKGHLLLMFDPPRASTSSWHNWKTLLQSIGVTLQNGIVVDYQNSYTSPEFVVGQVTDIAKHPILRSVGANNAVVLPGALAMQAASPAPPSLAITSLFETSSQSQSVSVNQTANAQPQPGPFVLAAAIDRTQSGTLTDSPDTKVTEGMRTVVVANASFITDNIFDHFANGPFFLGAVNWVVGNDALVSIPPKEPVTNSIDITASSRRFITLFALLVLPVLCLLVGGVVWWKRR